MKNLKIYRISQSENNGYDTYSSAVVIAEDENEAQHSCVCGWHKFHDGKLWFQYANGTENEEECCSGWTNYKNVEVELIGDAKEGSKGGVVCASFHAG